MVVHDLCSVVSALVAAIALALLTFVPRQCLVTSTIVRLAMQANMFALLLLCQRRFLGLTSEVNGPLLQQWGSVQYMQFSVHQQFISSVMHRLSLSCFSSMQPDW
jgi:hypothetical protein